MRIFETSRAPMSLRWEGDDLIDPADGFRRWTPDGEEHRGGFAFAYRFDRAVHSPSGRWTAVYEERGTKALVLDGRSVVREVNRSFYHAHQYDYPIALGALPDGREVLVHCPDHRGVLEIEDPGSGERLTTGEERGSGAFHSRLSLSPDGRRLAVAGWIWHPVGVLDVYDVTAALRTPSALDGVGLVPRAATYDSEVGSVCWLDADRLAVATTGEEVNPADPGSLAPLELGVWSFAASRWLHRCRSDSPWGTLVACGGDRVVSLYGHPRLADATTGAVLAEWPEVGVTRRESAYGKEPTAVVALHPGGTRLAIAVEDGIAVLDLPRT